MEEELEEERRVVREAEVEETGARSAPGRVTGKMRYSREKERKGEINNVSIYHSYTKASSKDMKINGHSLHH